MRVLVIGGGPAGVTAALHAAELGAAVTLIERGSVGGTALNSGPAPVRTLARAARLVRDWSSWETFGLRGSRPVVDLAATLANAERVAEHVYERRRVAEHIRAKGVDLVEDSGDARFLDANTVEADGQTWTADRFIIAVGGRASRLPIPGAELGLTYVKRYEHAFALACQLGDPCWEGIAARGIGRAAAARDEIDKALEWLMEARTRCVRLPDAWLWIEAYTLDALCSLAVEHRLPAAPAWIEALAGLAARTGMRHFGATANVYRGRLGGDAALTAARLQAAEIENPALSTMLREPPAPVGLAMTAGQN